MKKMTTFLLQVFLLCAPVAAVADNDWDEDRKRDRHSYREYKEEFWDGTCKVERKFKKNGEYKEKRECKPEHRVYMQPVPVVVPPPVIVEPGVTIHGSVRIH